MGAVGHSHHGLGMDGGPGWARQIARYVRALPVCEVGTLLTHDGTDTLSNLCVTE